MRGGVIALLGFAACGGPPSAPGDAGAPDGAAGPDAPEQPEQPTVLSVMSVEPDHGPFTGGTVAIVRGTNFDSPAVVYVGGRMVEPTYQTYVDPTRIQIVTPAGEPGPADVQVVLGDESAVREEAFTYDAFYVDPNRGSTAGGTVVSVVGQGTSFDDTTTVTVGGAPLADLEFVSATRMTGRTPPGEEGFADVEVATSEDMYGADGAFEYFSAVDPLFGGLGGGPIVGTLTVTVVDLMTDDFIEGAYVIVGDDETTPYQGLTDAEGKIVFSGDFEPPVSVTAYAESASPCSTYLPATIDSFDASEVLLFLASNPILSKECAGPPPGGILAGRVDGVIAFGGPTGVGSTDWSLVPEPGAGQFRCAHAESTRWNHWTPNPDPGPEAWMIYDEGAEATAWAFTLYPVRPGTMAVVAFAGHCVDGPDGLPVMTAAYAMGVQRGVVVGPGDSVDADVIMDIQLDEEAEVSLDDPPPQDATLGPTAYTLDVLMDLGGDGMLWLADARRTLAPSLPAATVGSLAPLAGPSLYDASYMFVASAATPRDLGGGATTPASPVEGFDAFLASSPFSVRVERGVTGIASPVVIGSFMGVPAPVDPISGGTITDLHMEWLNAGATASLNQVLLVDSGGSLAWWAIIDGPVTEYDLPDLTAAGFAPVPPQYMTWVIWEIHKPDYDFNLFTYGDVLRETLWDGFAATAYLVYWP